MSDTCSATPRCVVGGCGSEKRGHACVHLCICVHSRADAFISPLPLPLPFFSRSFPIVRQTKAWLRFAKFEAGVARDRSRARAVYERALSALEGEPNAQELYIKFAQFEEYAQEFEARPSRKTASETRLPIRAQTH